MSKPMKEVDEALSGEPQNISLKHRSNPKDPAQRAGIAKRIRQQREAARQMVDEANKAPPTPLPVPSTPVPFTDVHKSVTGTAPPSGDKPGPSIRADPISAIGRGIGGDSFEISLPQLEQQFTHLLMESMTIAHVLSVRAAFWEKKEAESDAKIKKVQADLRKAEEALALSAKCKEEMALKDQQLARLIKENHELKLSQKQEVEIGKRKGREDFLQSEEFQTMLKKARHDGVHDFKKSPEYVLMSQAVNNVMAAFKMCQAQLQELGDLNEGSDLSQLDVIKTENLEDYPDAIDEFRRADGDGRGGKNRVLGFLSST